MTMDCRNLLTQLFGLDFASLDQSRVPIPSWWFAARRSQRGNLQISRFRFDDTASHYLRGLSVLPCVEYCAGG